MWRVNSLKKTLMLGKIEGRTRSGWQRMRWLDGIINRRYMSLSKLQEIVKDREAQHAAVREVAKSWTRPKNWTTNQPRDVWNTVVNKLASLQFILKHGIWKTIYCKSHLDYFARTSIKNTTHWAHGLENWYSFSHSSEGWKSKIEVPPVLVLSEDSLLGLQMVGLLLVLYTGNHRVTSGPISHSSCKDTGHIGLEFHTPDTILTKSAF